MELKDILFLHAFTGCDSTSATFQRCKLGFVKIYPKKSWRTKSSRSVPPPLLLWCWFWGSWVNMHAELVWRPCKDKLFQHLQVRFIFEIGIHHKTGSCINSTQREGSETAYISYIPPGSALTGKPTTPRPGVGNKKATYKLLCWRKTK